MFPATRASRLVDRVVDHVTMIAGGRIVLSEPLAELEASHGGASLDDIFVARVGTASASPEGG